ncbi:MAG: hypothetical protein HC828_12885 [Blastochloris sp.]|nr:hypothetical protein [Blastochloris sp.]
MQQTDKKCPQCGRPARTAARFCGRCGAALTETQSVTDTTIPAAPGRTVSMSAPVEYAGRATEPLADEDWPRDTQLGAEGRYRIETILGKGGFGQAYLAWDTRLSRYCVVKRAVVKPGWSATDADCAGQFPARGAVARQSERAGPPEYS